MEDTMRGRLIEAARRLVASDQVYVRAREALDDATAENGAARVEILDAMNAAGIRHFGIGGLLFERDHNTVHWTRLDAVLPADPEMET